MNESGEIKLSQETGDEKQGYDVTLFDRLISEQINLQQNHAYFSNPSLSAVSVSATSSDSEVSNESCDSSRGLDWEQSDSSDSETRVIDGVIIPYEDEPLADCGEEVSPNANEEETDIDGLTPST